MLEAPIPSQNETRANQAFDALLMAHSRPGDVQVLPVAGEQTIVEALLNRECRVYCADPRPMPGVLATGAMIAEKHMQRTMCSWGTRSTQRPSRGSELAVIWPIGFGAGGSDITLTQRKIAAAKTRVPRSFRAPLPIRIRRAVLWTGFVGLFCYCLWAFDFSPERIWVGLGRLGHVLGFIFPPHVWDNWRDFSEVLNGLGDTLAIAFLGVLLGAGFCLSTVFPRGQKHQSI